MKYKGIELVEITEEQIFYPPRLMLVWDEGMTEAIKEKVCAILLHRTPACRVVGYYNNSFAHCAAIPEEPKPRRATNRELAKWLAQGKGEYTNPKAEYYDNYSSFSYKECNKDEEVYVNFKVRKWDDAEWHEPDVQYMGIEAESV